MEFKQYPSYKNSGVEWLGDVPDEWDIYPFWHLFNRKEITNKTQEQLLSVYLDRGVILHSEGGGMVHKPADNLEKYQLVEVNDFVMNNQQAWRGSVGVSPYKGIVSPAYLIFSFNKKICAPKFFKYFLRDKGVVDQFMNASMSVGTIQRQVKWHLLKTIQLSIPSLIEQNTIANFLDTETTRIDNLIAKQEKLIELLEEQRKSIISHAVTKGLNPNAPMKDSGVEWLGEVPEHWEVTRLKNIGKSIIGLTYSPNEICNPDDDSYLVLRSSNVQNGQLSFLDNVYVKSYVSEKLKIKKNDILICSRNGSRDLIGKNTIIKNPPKNSTFGAFMTVYRSEHADYVYWILNSYIFKAQAGSYLTTTVNQLTINNLNNMTVPFAPTSEQNEIVEFLSTENLKFNNLISKQKALIEKLKEYRASIISHAVTGKIDVREFGA